MIKIKCSTNLDLLPCETWPEYLPTVPRKGDLIQSQHSWNHFKLSLEVVRVRWVFNDTGIYYPRIELHDPQKRSIRGFYEWYAPLVGRSVSHFI